MTAFVEWNKGREGGWCTLAEVDLEDESFQGMEGVYVLWSGRDNPITLRVGQGYIKGLLASELANHRLAGYRAEELFVTWARVNQLHRADVARYLAKVLEPTLGDRYPEGSQIPVNLPQRVPTRRGPMLP